MPVDANAKIEVTAYAQVPQMARGFVKDMRVRWALEEIGLPYRVRLVGGAGGGKSPEHLADQPFGQVPVYKENGLTLFETGAILLQIGEKDDRLLPRDTVERARAIAWTFAALNSVEPYMQMVFVMGFAAHGKAWQEEAKASLRPFAQKQLSLLAAALGDRDWLEDRFTIGDLVMADVLRAVSEDELVAVHPNLTAYVERATKRPAFGRALSAQLADFDQDLEAA